MVEYAISPPQVAAVPVLGGGLFPVRRIFCVGRNYAAHAREMGADPDREPPFFFTKPADAVLTGGADMPYPPATSDLHHEMELVVALGSGGADIPVAEALNHVWGYAAGLDMTRRDLQAAAKKAGKPWDMSKGFDASAPIGDLLPAFRLPDPTRGRIALAVNGTIRQESDLSQMIWSIAETIACLSGLVRLAPGDLIFTGTPEGVAAVGHGDVLEGTIEGVGSVRTRIV
ncbi:Fumarylacetoacetate hydrolase family protein [Rhodovastum atsumiense]|uniref:Fumarylacetoacetate hydrolase family protein n=1 Tax=Rhodovastum atsumiense TaxID=504468 RepID=A0A5M6IXG1_9PROT|nr:fumarylacetoacetate hydrolase family protein [Rhodovastum atsumiense]KAA5612527.1 fumarylacetoacetate hydrolase family protein [Rhodovastum atsumiense]CAH2601394.1 Fumarylacetoacetate hydrolase family protein [Rhodovastum atsumiense]